MKMIQLNYCKAHWTDDWKELFVDEKDKSILVNTDHIATVSPDVVQGRAVDKNGITLIALHHVRTTIPYCRTDNGTDYYSYYVTEETYQKILVEALS